MKRNNRLKIRTCVWGLSFLVSLSNLVCAQTVISYEKAMEIAMENSPEIRRTRLDLERNRELLNAQNAALKSNFRLTLNPFNFSRDRTFNRFFSAWSTNETKQSIGMFSITQPIKQTDGTISLINHFSWQDSYSDYKDVRNKTFNNSLYLSFEQPIFTYNRTKLELRELELNLESTMLAFAVQKLALERQVAAGFYNVYQNKMSLDIAREELQNQERSYEIIKNKVDAGLAALEELYQAELNLATSRSNLQNRQVALENSLDNFKLLIGIPLDEPVTIDADITYEVVDVDLAKAVDTALKNRMELRQRKISIENAEHDLIRTRATNEFKGSITLSYGIVGTDERLADLYGVPTKKQTVGLTFDIPLWDWGEKKSRIKATKTTIESRRLSLEEERNNVIIGIRQSYRNLLNLTKQIEIAQQNVRNAELTYEINLERYRNGDLTSMDLSLFQNQLSQKKMGLVQALISYKLALLDLKIQSLWDFERNEPVLPEGITENE